jgi:hypothetical protein
VRVASAQAQSKNIDIALPFDANQIENFVQSTDGLPRAWYRWSGDHQGNNF